MASNLTDHKRRTASGWHWAGIGGLCAAWIAGLSALVGSQQSWELRNRLMVLSPWFLWLAVVSLGVAVWINRELLKVVLFDGLSRKHQIAIGFICGLACILVVTAAPRTHRLYYDEDIYQAIGLNIAQNNRAAMSNDGRWEYGHFRSYQMEFNKQPNGWPFLLSLVYRVFGASETAGFNLANGLFVVAVFLVFLTGKLLFGDPVPGLFAALVYTLIPENVRWFSTMDADPPTACFTVLAMAATLLFLRWRTRSALFLMISAWAWALQFRFEVMLLGGLVFLMVYLDAWEEFKSPQLYGFITLLLVLLFAHVLQLIAVRQESWGSSGEKLSMSYFWPNLITNSLYYFNTKQFPLLFSLFALMGLALPGPWKPKLYGGLWFLLSWVIFLFFYAGGYQFGVDVRYAILSFAPLALLSGYGIHLLLGCCSRWFQRDYVLWGINGVLLITGVFYLPYMRSLGAESWQCRVDHKAAESFASLVPEDGIILTHNPNMFQMFGKNAAQLSLLAPPSPYAAHVLTPQFKDNIYIHWNYWCNTQSPVQVQFCIDVLGAYRTQLVAETKLRDQRFALYRVLGSTATPHPSL